VLRERAGELGAQPSRSLFCRPTRTAASL
jgi:hypothetical protein